MPRCKAPEILRNEAYLDVRRNDEGLGKRSRWAFFSRLLMYIFMVCERSDLVDSDLILEIKLLKKGAMIHPKIAPLEPIHPHFM